MPSAQPMRPKHHDHSDPETATATGKTAWSSAPIFRLPKPEGSAAAILSFWLASRPRARPCVDSPTGRDRQSTTRLRSPQRSWSWNRIAWLALTRTAILRADDAKRR